jgi:hypothetical protein
MKPSLYVVLVLAMFATVLSTTTMSASGSALVTTFSPLLYFEGARPGIHPSQPLTMPVANGSEVTVLHLGDYSAEDSSQTRTLTREMAIPGEWEAALIALRGVPGVSSGQAWYWLGLDPAWSSRSGFGIDVVRDPYFLYNLQQIDVTPNFLRVWNDNVNTFHSAEFRVRFIWLVPEPSSWLLAFCAGCVCWVRRRRKEASRFGAG